MHWRRALLPLVLLVAVVYTQCSPDDRALATETVRPLANRELTVAAPPRTLEELKQRIAAVVAEQKMAGAAIALVGRDGPIWVGGVGVRDRATAAPMEADSMFRVGSLSKSIVALGVMRLVDQGKLDVDRPLRELLPGMIDNPWEDIAPVTLAQLMEHTAGLDDIRFNEIFATDEGISVADVLAINPRSKRVRWRPGTRHAYSNVGYTIAARAIEVVTGEPFDVYLRREIMEPMGIRDAEFKRTEPLRTRLVTGYLDEERPAAFHPLAHRPSASLLISASDLGKLVQFWIRRGEGYPPIVSKASLARIERTGTLPYPHLDNEYGFANYGDVEHPVFSRGHDGGMPGFHASFRYFPGLDVGYAMLLNSPYAFQGYVEIRSLLYAYLTQDREVPRLAVPTTTLELPAANFYGMAAPRSELFAFLETAQLGWRVWTKGNDVNVAMLDGSWSGQLVPTPDGAYRWRWQCGSSVRFTTNVDGTPVMVMGFLYAEARHGLYAELRFYGIRIAFLLVALAPPWAAITLLVYALRRRRTLPYSLLVWPALAGISCPLIMHLLELAFHAGVAGVVHPLTVASCGATILFAVASTASLLSTIRWSMRPDRPPLLARVFPALCSVAFFAITLWFAANHLIGFRSWAW